MTDPSSRKIRIFMRHHHKIVYFFEEAEAINETNAISFEKFNDIVNIKLSNKIKIRNRKWAYKRLLQKSVIIKNSDDSYYIDLEKFEDYKKWYFVLVTSIVIPSILFLMLGLAWILTAI